LDVHVEASRHDIDGLVEALLRDAEDRPDATRRAASPASATEEAS
jgi:hypothetical protein